MNVFLVSNYPDCSPVHLALEQVTVSTFSRLKHVVFTTYLPSDNQYMHKKPKHFRQTAVLPDRNYVLSDRYKVLVADKIVFQLLLHGKEVPAVLEEWCKAVLSNDFINEHAGTLSKKSALIILSPEPAQVSSGKPFDTLSQKILVECFVNKFLKAAGVKAMPTFIAVDTPSISKKAQQTYIQQFSKKIHFYALLLSSSVQATI